MTEPLAAPIPAPGPVSPPLACGLCGGEALVHWQRRLTDPEFADYLHAIQTRRDELTLLADPQQQPPDFGPLPTQTDVTRAVGACIHHAIGQDAAARIHTKACTAPNAKTLPACDCTPEPLPAPEPDPAPQELPPGWH
ncbi:hypothetical protein DT019_02910 [Streptomyces sp. SDr-06]|uniref:hypothetical protein n=1 Tax=Streptomyces sp. SDr-06 TaxID=2267702 RepID=UPI000DEA7F99|nr:hypothetical protein [Streptomyces sp. SDr-06]RCH70453.1 hypothetical protein DT019_02910 [Streptomyces sp. SDr-06]